MKEGYDMTSPTHILEAPNIGPNCVKYEKIFLKSMN